MTPTRHEQLIAAGWRYDANAAKYAMPGGVLWYTQSEAWVLHEAASKREIERMRKEREW
jgi:hypothetical protein